MSARVQQELARLFDEAERERRCVFTDEPNEAQRLYRARLAGTAVSPMRRLFSRRAYWKALTPREQAFHLVRSLAALRPDTVFCGPTAALIHGLAIPDRHLIPLHVATTPHRHGGSSSTLVRDVIHADCYTHVRGYQVTTLTRTVYDCLRLLDPDESEPFIRSAMDISQLSDSELAGAIRHEYAGRRGITRVMSRLRMFSETRETPQPREVSSVTAMAGC